ncbi:MAG: DUF2442 domain-containing protein [Lachnospiraceae bacterium]|nr:DUF2442 domain-containing protein [Lachnospiraceae bacterium]
MTARGNPTAVFVRPMEDYKLLITFENSETRVFDVKPMLKEKEGTWFGNLLDRDYFRTVRIGGGSVEWPDEQDICPDCLYEDSISYVQEKC